MNAGQGFTHIVEFSRSERELRRKRKEEICHFNVRLFVGLMVVICCYTLFGYIGKWMWYYDDIDGVSYNIADWEQLVSAVMGFHLVGGFYAAVKMYCPVCGRYSNYEKNKVKMRQFWCYQLGLLIWIIVFAGLVKLIELAYTS